MASKAQRQEMPDRLLLYSAAVQSADADIDFMKRVFRKRNTRSFRSMREDFCGSALLACEWVRRAPENRALGVDFDRETLEWSRRHYVPRIGEAASRLDLVEGDVLEIRGPRVDVVTALNFSYMTFKERSVLLDYFKKTRRRLNSDGLFILDILGGGETCGELVESRHLLASVAFDGTRLPRFTYTWEQAGFNAINHHLVCHIHFKMRGRRPIRRAFSYDWRLWTLPELRDLLHEAGFSDVEVYLDGWDDEADEADGIFRLKNRFENQASWIAYVVAGA